MLAKQLATLIILFLLSLSYSQTTDIHNQFIENIYQETLTAKNTHKLLGELCQKYPKRLSGSKGLEGSIQWTKTVMEDFDFDKVFLQEVMVPHWVRGEKESASYINNKGKTENLNVLTLGRSIGTSSKGIVAEIVQVSSLEEISRLGKSKIYGKIVFINKPFEQHFIRTFEGYSKTVKIRSKGASEAARYGAVACIIRSVGTADDDFAHTGALKYAADVPQIPAAALGVKSAKKLARALKHNPKTRLKLKINSNTLPDVLSHNVIGEIRGSEHPEKIILVGGHLDAWDVGQGAHDDGSGCMQSVMALRTLQNLDYQPKNTMRVVLFTNEENGLRGAEKYAEVAKRNKDEHIFAMESDAGGFSPRAISLKGPKDVVNEMNKWTHFFPNYTIERIHFGGAAVDLGPLNKKTGVLVGNLIPDSQRYFDFHHTNADVFEAVNARELEMGTASMASFIYLVDQLGL